MRAALERARRRLACEEGFTLAELLMATLLGVFVVGIATTVVTAAVNSQAGLATRDNAIRQARWTTERLVRELRQGGTVYTATAGTLSFLTYVHSATCGGAPSTASSIQCRVTYTCSPSGTCTRTEANPDGTGGAVRTVVSGLSNGSVFSYSPDPSIPRYVGVTFVFPGQNGHDAITVSDGAALMDRPANS